MKHILIVCTLIVIQYAHIFAQPFTDSNLPIVLITTDLGAPIVDNPRVRGTMKIIYRGQGERNYVSDKNTPAYLNYNGRIEIEFRGSSSQAADKKQYGFSTLKPDNSAVQNVKLLGMPDENDWILNGMVWDPALIRDYLSYNLSRQIGEYASRTAYCEVMINNSYMGLYVLQEKIKADDNRVNVTDIEITDNTYPRVSGGYITKADKTTGDDPVAWWMQSKQNYGVGYIHHQPKPIEVTAPQNNYIHAQFQALETTALNGNTSLENGYPSVIDLPSFVNFMLINELASNADAYMYSTFFHKDRNGKLRAGPVWDHDLTYGNDLFIWGFDRSKPNVWQFSNGDNDGSRFWWDLQNNATFHCYLARRWNELTAPGQPLHPDKLDDFIDQTVAYTSEAVGREYIRWGVSNNYSQRIQEIKAFLHQRITWMTTNLGSYSGCTDIPLPPLVITKIMYHPSISVEFPDEDELEYIEITNNGNQVVPLTGIYFRGTGLVCQIPANSSLGPYGTMVLAANPTIFKSRHGRDANGEFSRHLSNKSQSLVLADGFGNIIDSLTYTDTIPWPEADGNGYYLQLNDPGLDNSLAENWTASNVVFVSDNPVSSEIVLQVFPNPVHDFLRIRAHTDIHSVSLYDLQGRLLLSEQVNREEHALDMSRFNSGTYIIKILTADQTYTRKIVKE
jgi:hypothetical protein